MDILQRQTISHPFVIGISGVSSSGKTTLSRTLAKIFPHSILLHQDDFFHPASLVPFHSSGEHDWDCVDAIDWDQMRIVLSSIRETGKLPDGFSSITGASPVDSKEKVHDSEELIERMWSKLEVAGMVVLGRKIVIVDGFLMFFDGSPIETMMDAKFLLRISKDVAKSRREARTGYYTIEGFMTDPPGYFDNLVWPSYARCSSLCPFPF
jgi:nicotinamide/nicotinate riboside kinase